MQYSTKIDKTCETLFDVAQLVSRLEEERVLAAVLNKRLTHDDIVDYTLRLREKRTRQQLEIESLRKFSRSFNREYATNHNNCFSTAIRLFGIIRSNMSETFKLFKKFCPTVMTPGPIVDGVVQRPGVIDHTMLNTSIPFTPQMFGMEGCEPCVQEFIDELKKFFRDVESALVMCEEVISEESLIKKDTARCLQLYETCCNDVLKNSYEFIEYFGEQGFAREDRISSDMHKLPTLQDFASTHFHMHNKNEFQIHVLHQAYSEGKANELTDIETFLWPANHEMALKARVVLEHIDELLPRGRQIGDTGRYRINGKHVAVFMKWCEIKDTKKEKHFVEKYFNQHYHGAYETIASTTVNTAKNKLLYDEVGEKSIRRELDQLVSKYYHKQ